MITKEDIFSKTNDGLDIILHFYPQAKEVVNQLNKPFKIRPTDDTPSAYIKKIKGIWRVTDFGMGETAMNGIDVCMYEMDIKFNEAINYLASQFGITSNYIDVKVNKAEIRKRPATEAEPDGHFHFEIKETITQSELAVLGPHVKVEHCKELGYSSLKYYSITRNGETTTIYSNDNYPIFIRECRHIDPQKKESRFYKIYQPLNSDKKYRFFYAGTKPHQYINGLIELQEKYIKFKKQQEQTDEYTTAIEKGQKFTYKKLPAAFIMSGERDALCLKAHDENPLWFNSEGYKLSESEYKEITKYVEVIYQVPDIDATGKRLGIQRAMKYIDIYTVWLPNKLKNFRDQRGKFRKDFRDFCEIWPDKDRFNDLLNIAMPIRFWEYMDDGKGRKRLDINTDYVSYFLRCNGFVALEDKNSKTGQMFVNIQGNIVEEVRAKLIKNYLKRFVRERYLPVHIRNIVNNSSRLSESNLELEEVELSFEDFTPDSQYFFFTNAVWEVTGTKIKEYKPGDINKYVWKSEVIPYPVKRLESAFKITKNKQNEEEQNELYQWDIDIRSDHTSNFLRYLINASRIFWRKEYEDPDEDPEVLKQYKKENKFRIDGDRLTEEEIAEQKLHLINKIFSIGYLLHRYKAENRAWCVFAMDHKIGDIEDSNGGSGKSFCYKSLRLFMNSVTLSGRNPKLTENKHVYENVTEHTDYILIDDTVQYFDFDFFFDAVTGDITVNPKFTKSYEISFPKAPKYAITSNYTLRKFDPSSERRILYTVFSDYYHQKTADNDYKETRKIYDDFGKNLFRENYTPEEWNADINFFVDCCQFYLSVVGNGQVILPPMKNVIDRNQKAQIHPAFSDWAETFFAKGSPNCDRLIPRELAFSDFERISKVKNWKTNQFTKNLRIYCKNARHIIELNPEEFQNASGRITRKYDFNDNRGSVAAEMIYVRTKQTLNYTDNNVELENEDENDQPITEQGTDRLPF